MNSSPSIFLFWCTALIIGCGSDFGTVKRNCTAVDRLPEITPDYAGVTIPPNIAPLHFSLGDSSVACIAEIASVKGSPVTVRGKNGAIRIAAAAWKRLVSENAGNPLHITIYARGKREGWRRYRTIENVIAAEPVDRYCTYRLLNFQYSYWRDLRICQRDLSSFTEKELVSTLNYTQKYTRSDAQNDARNQAQNRAFKCVNCHIPMNNDPDRFVLQLRSIAYGSETLIADGDSITTLSSRLGHAAWHPTGRYIAFAIYKVQQYFHAVGRQPIDVYDNNSGIVMYSVTDRKVISVPQLDREGVLETWPAWAPDGRHLYFCAAPVPWSDYSKEPPDNFNKTKYSLLRIAYDPDRNSWGNVDTVLSAGQTGRSMALPRISPDNRFCLFCMQDFGPYPYIESTSDLYLMDIGTRQYDKLPVNSQYTESWHSWSTNGRWILFSSRRGDGIFTRLYISHIDSAGNAGKPFVLPQRDPAFYDSFTKCFNVAEFAVAPVRFSERKLFKAIQARHSMTVPVPETPAFSGGAPKSNDWMYGGGRE